MRHSDVFTVLENAVPGETATEVRGVGEAEITCSQVMGVLDAVVITDHALDLAYGYYEYRCLALDHQEWKRVESLFRKDLTSLRGTVSRLLENYRKIVNSREDDFSRQVVAVKDRLEQFTTRVNCTLHFDEREYTTGKIARNIDNIIGFKEELLQLAERITDYEKYFSAQVYLQFKANFRTVKDKISGLMDTYQSLVGSSTDPFAQRLRSLRDRFEFFGRTVNHRLWFDEDDNVVDKVLESITSVFAFRETTTRFLHEVVREEKALAFHLYRHVCVQYLQREAHPVIKQRFKNICQKNELRSKHAVLIHPTHLKQDARLLTEGLLQSTNITSFSKHYVLLYRFFQVHQKVGEILQLQPPPQPHADLEYVPTRFLHQQPARFKIVLSSQRAIFSPFEAAIRVYLNTLKRFVSKKMSETRAQAIENRLMKIAISMDIIGNQGFNIKKYKMGTWTQEMHHLNARILNVLHDSL
jgi:hypothetical protein